MKDLIGKAIWDYYYNEDPQNIYTETSISELDTLPIEYLFRTYEEMNIQEKTALDLSYGSVLDVGAGAGSHSLYLKKHKHLEVTAIDISQKSIHICKERGLENALCVDFMKFSSDKKYDTILLLMNGTGLFQSLDNIDFCLRKLSELLAPNGQILMDSTDIIYMYDTDDDGGVLIPMNGYYGELEYIVHYKKETEDPMKWLYLDYNTLKNAAENNGFTIENKVEYDSAYLAKLTKK